MRYHSLTNDAPFEALDIPCPGKLETTEDYAQLMQHMGSRFRLALNIGYRRYGYETRTELLAMMVLLLSSIMPEQHPEYITNYPDSLEDIYTLVGGFLTMTAGREAERKAG